MDVNSPIERVKGVGPKTQEQFANAGLHTVGDVINYLPFRHEDFTAVASIADISPGKQTVRARVESVEVRRVRRAMTVTTATLADQTGKVKAVWFNQPYRADQLKGGEEFFFSGNFEFRYNRFQLSQPGVERVSEMPVQGDRILPVYRQVKGLKNQVLRKVLVELKPLLTMLPETLPDWMVQEYQLVSHSEALLGMHFPESAERVAAARHRQAFEELLPLLMASQYIKRSNDKLTSPSIPFHKKSIQNFVEKLPFRLTDSQRMAAWEIIQDIEQSIPMNRMLQGDVGAGKTVVAAMAAYSAAQSGYQTAFMAPTEVLATQHAESLQKLLEPLGVTVALLTGSVKGAARQVVNEQIASGGVAVIVGTHALIQDAVTYFKLGLVVIDEQHRFGVAQRQALLQKSRESPHVLAMTATPIPRSLQLTVFGELEVSVMKQLPKDRLPIQTTIIAPTSLEKTYQAVDQEIAAGRQVYVICRLIDDSTKNQQQSVESEYRRLKNSILGKRTIAKLHGRMKSTEKDAIMSDFKAGKYDILISTTVVEVGVDVPNASVIMIKDADQFGLAQLHQLRGRVGRGVEQSYCYLVMSDAKKPSQRLREIEKSNDGFYLAEVDLRLRGPGEIYGRMQHGDLNLQIATLDDQQLIVAASRAASQFIKSKEKLEDFPVLHEAVKRQQKLTMLN